MFAIQEQIKLQGTKHQKTNKDSSDRMAKGCELLHYEEDLILL